MSCGVAPKLVALLRRRKASVSREAVQALMMLVDNNAKHAAPVVAAGAEVPLVARMRERGSPDACKHAATVLALLAIAGDKA